MSLRMYVLRDIIGKGGGKVPLTPPPYMLYANYKDMKICIRIGLDIQQKIVAMRVNYVWGGVRRGYRRGDFQKFNNK